MGSFATDVLADDDFQRALYVFYELHYRGFEGVDPECEWDLGLLEVRKAMEDAFLDALRVAVGSPSEDSNEGIDARLYRILRENDVPEMPRFLEAEATDVQFREYVIHRSAYQLKEADPHSWAIPRLGGQPKAALIEIQADEYGNGSLQHMHSELFARTMDELGLDSRYGHYVTLLPGVTLATVNVMSFFGIHRLWRGATIGHLAAFEMGSSLPNRRYSNGLERLGYSKKARAFYDVHVIADAAHENVAAVDLAGGLAAQDAALVDDILFGARSLAVCEGRLFNYLMDSWKHGDSSLLGPHTP